VSTDSVLADINAALESWESAEDAAEWRADGGPDELAESKAPWPSALTGGTVTFQPVCATCRAEIGEPLTVDLLLAMSGPVTLPEPLACPACSATADRAS
jgi:hypothetical protein